MSEGSGQHHLSIWFLIGLLLAVYGALILGAGVEQLWVPPQPPVAMEQLHLGIWWGGGLLAIGLVYTGLFRPSRQRRRAQERAEAQEHWPIPGSLPTVPEESSKED